MRVFVTGAPGLKRRSVPANVSPMVLDRGPLGGIRGGRVGPVVLVGEREVGVVGLSACADGVEIIEVAPANASTPGRERRGRGIGSGEGRDLMSGGEQFSDGRRTDPTR